MARALQAVIHEQATPKQALELFQASTKA